jgi:hypothetical protein
LDLLAFRLLEQNGLVLEASNRLASTVQAGHNLRMRSGCLAGKESRFLAM